MTNTQIPGPGPNVICTSFNLAVAGTRSPDGKAPFFCEYCGRTDHVLAGQKVSK